MKLQKLNLSLLIYFGIKTQKTHINGTKSSAMIEANYLSSCTEIYF